MAKNWSDTPYEDAVREQATSQTDYRALAALLAQALSLAYDQLTTQEWLSIEVESKLVDALDAARKAGIL